MPEYADLNVGLAAHCTGDLVAAIEVYESALHRNPNDVAALVLRMAAAQDARDQMVASQIREHLEDVLQQDPAGMLPLAQLFLGQKRFDLAMATVLFLRQQCNDLDLRELRNEIQTRQNSLCGARLPDDFFTRDILIVCPIYVATSIHKLEIELWISGIERFNPGIDWLMVDDGSRIDRLNFLSPATETNFIKLTDDHPQPIALNSPRTVASFPTNAGHPLSGRGLDGPARSMIAGIKSAIHNRYRYTVILESDVYTRLSLRLLTDRMQKREMKVMTTRVVPWNFIESGFLVLDTAHLATIRYADRYPWERISLLPHVEWIYEAVLGTVTNMRWTGGRNDFDDFDVATIQSLDYLTHSRDHSLYARYLAQ